MFPFTSEKTSVNVVRSDVYTPETDKKDVEYEQLLESGQKIPLMLLVNILIGSLTVFIIWDLLPSSIFVVWIVLFTVSLITRTILFFTYQNAQIVTMRRWQNYFIFASFFNGIVWGAVGILIETYAHELYHGLESFILGGMAVGAIVTSSSIRWNFPAFIYPMLMSIVVYFLLQNDTMHYYMAAMILVFILVLSTFSFNFRNLQYERLVALKRLNRSQERLKGITSSMGEGVYVMDCNKGLEFINPEAEKLLGWTFEEIKDADIHALIHIHNEETGGECIVQKAYENKERYHSETELFKKKNGEIFPVSITASPIDTDAHTCEGAVVIFKDITERKKMQEELTQLALYDKLTKLYNRGSFDKKLSEELDRSNRYDKKFSLLMFDIDFFKKVNDTYGHQAGDEALKSVANIIRKSIRTNDYPTRFGGEEFIVILPETESTKAVKLADRIRKIIEVSDIHISETETIHITISVGVATSHKGISTDELIKNVDDALYQAKNSGRNQVSVHL